MTLESFVWHAMVGLLSGAIGGCLADRTPRGHWLDGIHRVGQHPLAMLLAQQTGRPGDHHLLGMRVLLASLGGLGCLGFALAAASRRAREVRISLSR
jgi:hypothetical protein